jgi:hypothetical protein
MHRFNLYLVLGLTLAAPLVARGAAIIVNSTCEAGQCVTGGFLGNGQSTSGTLDFDYTFPDGDSYDISGDYSASYSSTDGSTISIEPVVTYIGTGLSADTDTIDLTMLQNFFDLKCCTWAGLYTESIPLTGEGSFGAGSEMYGQLYYDSVGVGPVGPFPAPGNYFETTTTDLDFGALDTNPTLAADFELDFTFGAGTAPGASEAASSLTAEPASLALSGLGLFALGFGAYRRNRYRIFRTIDSGEFNE